MIDALVCHINRGDTVGASVSFFCFVVVVVLVELVVVVEVALIGLDVAVVIGVLSLAMNDSLWLISLVYHIKVDEVLVFVLGSVFLWVGLMVVVVMMSVGVVTSHSRVPEGFVVGVL